MVPMPLRILAVATLALGLVTTLLVGSAGALTRTTDLVSQPTGVADPNTADVSFRRASEDGARVIFQTTQRLTADDNDAQRDDVYERAGGVTTLLSKPTGVGD